MAAKKGAKKKAAPKKKVWKKFPLTKAPSGGTVYRFTRWATNTLTFNEGLVDYLNAIQFQLSNVSGVSDFTNLYQEYCISKVELFWYPKANVKGSTTVAAQTTSSIVYTAFDPNDIVVPATLQELKEMAGCRTHYGYRPFKLTIYPKVALAAYDGAFTGFATPKGYTWLNTDYPTIRHYGLKFGLAGNDSSTVLYNSYSIEMKFTLAFRRAR